MYEITSVKTAEMEWFMRNQYNRGRRIGKMEPYESVVTSGVTRVTTYMCVFEVTRAAKMRENHEKCRAARKEKNNV